MNTLRKSAVALLPAIALIAILTQAQSQKTLVPTDIPVPNATYEFTP